MNNLELWIISISVSDEEYGYWDIYAICLEKKVGLEIIEKAKKEYPEKDFIMEEYLVDLEKGYAIDKFFKEYYIGFPEDKE